MKLIEKIANAKREIKETKLIKEGENKFSNYKYFTPTQIEYLVHQACFNNGLLTKFDLIRDNLGVYGILTIFDIDTNEILTLTMASAIPEIKATNIAQQLGGAMTYTERYLKTSAFGITDNNLDFDNHNNMGPTPAPTPPTPSPAPTQKPTLIVLDDEKNFTKQWINVTEAVKAGKIKNVEQIKSVYNISPIVEETLNELLNQKK